MSSHAAAAASPPRSEEPTGAAGGDAPLPSALRHAPATAWRGGRLHEAGRAVPEETAVALTYNGTTYAVMMASPADLEDFALGFSLTEGIVAAAEEVEAVEAVCTDEGIDLRIRLANVPAAALHARRRRIAGPTGCGLCGVESLAEALRPPRRVESDLTVEPGTIARALAALAPAQRLNRATRAVHGAGFWRPGQGLVALREDVGRHNALDKLAGTLARAGVAAADGLILVTSRLSVEMVQKAAAIGAPLLVAVSAPTALALRTAETAGVTLVAIARDDGFEAFTHRHRILREAACRVL